MPHEQEVGFVPDEFIDPNNPDYKSGPVLDLDAEGTEEKESEEKEN
ncbi:MAG: hypothetical protein Q8Q39_05285 [bacterium]|nr:hypothetical protein [bacterium]